MKHCFDYEIPTDAGTYVVTLEVGKKDETIDLHNIVTYDGDTHIDLSVVYLMKADGVFVSLEGELAKTATAMFFDDGGFHQIERESDEYLWDSWRIS